MGTGPGSSPIRINCSEMKLTDRKAFGRTGLQIPRVVYGTSYLGNLYRELAWKEKLELMERWFQCTEKPVVIDTAGKYGAGLALEMIGKGLAELGIDPGDVLISNKLGWYRVPLKGDEPTFEPGAWAGLEHDCIQTFGYQEIINCFWASFSTSFGILALAIFSLNSSISFVFSSISPNSL